MSAFSRGADPCAGSLAANLVRTSSRVRVVAFL